MEIREIDRGQKMSSTIGVSIGRRGLCSSSRLANVLKARAGQSIVWMAPCAQAFKSDTATMGSNFAFHNEVDPTFFAGDAVPERATTIVVSAQQVSKPFLQAWRERYSEEKLTLVRRGTSLGSIDLDAAKGLGINVLCTPGINSPHVAKFVVDTLGLSETASSVTKAVVIGSGSVGQCIISLLNGVGVRPTVVNRSPESPSLESAFRDATHVAVCAATSSEPIIKLPQIKELLAGEARAIKICSVSRPEAFSLEAIMMVAQRKEPTELRFDYGDSILAPTRERVNQKGVQENITWSSNAMASEACKADMDEAVLRLFAQTSVRSECS